jgi:hypothetical protein
LARAVARGDTGMSRKLAYRKVSASLLNIRKVPQGTSR